MKSPTTSMLHGYSFAVLAFAALGCGGQSLDGTWVDPDATTKLPQVVGGGDLNVDATLVLDEEASPPTFQLALSLGLEGLSDTVDARGTFESTEADLTLKFEKFVIPETSKNTAEVAEDGSQCLYLSGFFDTPVCFPSPQTNPYTLDETLKVTIEQSIAGDAVSRTELTMAPSE